uniref:Eukaryotic peptide chain release factor GTP-binding subunit ERF3A-like isoform X3 n=1 Tax=Rhizophora mucronata TaxID=61149 RepID=A0A2P2LVJ3_RHIMU
MKTTFKCRFLLSSSISSGASSFSGADTSLCFISFDSACTS